MTGEFWQWVANNGLAVVIVIAGGIGIWKTAAWLATNVVTPLKDAFVQHLHGISVFMTATSDSLAQTAKSIEVISEQMQGIREDVDYMRSSEERKVP